MVRLTPRQRKIQLLLGRPPGDKRPSIFSRDDTWSPEKGPYPDHEAISRVAYEYYLKRGGTPGNDWADWFQAEATLRDALRN